MFKKVTKYLFSAAAVFAAVFTLGGAEVSAADYTIGLNEEKEFTSIGYDENVVNFTAPKTGSFHVEVVLTDTFNKEGKSVNFTNVWLKQSLVCDYKKLWSGSGNRDNGIVSTPEYCLPAGKTVSIKLAGNFADTTYKYKVKVVNVADKYFEKESNDNAKKATSIKKKKYIQVCLMRTLIQTGSFSKLLRTEIISSM